MNKELNVIHGRKALEDIAAINRMANRAMIVESDPGAGKTDITTNLIGARAQHVVPEGFDADKVAPEGVQVRPIRIGRHEEYDFPGIPWAKDSGMVIHYHPLLQSIQYGDVVILDEFKLKGANKFAMQFLEGLFPTSGDWVGPEHVFRIGLANGADSGALECVESPVLGNRAAQYHWTGPTAGEWCEWARESALHPSIVTTVHMEGDKALKDYQAIRMRNATPRSTHMASDAMYALERYMALDGLVPTHEQRITTLAGYLPDETVMLHAAVFNLQDKLVPFSTIVSAPATTPIPDSPAAMMMLCSSVGNKTTPQNYSDVMRYVARLPIEIQGAIVDPVLKRYPELGADTLTHEYLARSSNLRK